MAEVKEELNPCPFCGGKASNKLRTYIGRT